MSAFPIEYQYEKFVWRSNPRINRIERSVTLRGSFVLCWWSWQNWVPLNSLEFKGQVWEWTSLSFCLSWFGYLDWWPVWKASWQLRCIQLYNINGLRILRSMMSIPTFYLKPAKKKKTQKKPGSSKELRKSVMFQVEWSTQNVITWIVQLKLYKSVQLCVYFYTCINFWNKKVSLPNYW